MAERSEITKIEPLTGSNYQSWKYNMKLILMERGLWSFAEGNEIEPEETATDNVKRTHRTRSEKAYSLIALSIQKSLQIHIASTTDPKEAWDILQKQFAFVSITQIVRLCRKFYAATMQEDDDLMEHLTLMTTLAEQLRELKEDISSQKFATVVLGSLPSSYDTFLTSLNARKADDLDWDSLKGSLIEEYMKRKEKNNPNKCDDALYLRNMNSRNHSQRNQPIQPRDLRSRGSHFENSRADVNRDVSNSSGRQPHKQYGGERPTCFKCGQTGHIARNCFSRNSTSRRWSSNKDGRYEEGNFVEDMYNSINDDVALINSDSYHAKQSEWFIDSGASQHMAFDRSIFVDFIDYIQPSEIFLGDSTIILAEGEGKVRLPTYSNNSSEPTFISLQKVLYVPELTKNLLSVAAMAKMGAEICFDKEKCVIFKNNKYITIGHTLNGKLYKVNTEHACISFTNCASLELWHYRLGHLNHDYVEQLAKGDLVSGMMFKDNGDTQRKACEPCILGKMHRESLPKHSNNRAASVLEIVHSDVCGPIEVESKGGSRYLLTFTDDFSRYTTIYFLQNKSEVMSKFKDYVTQMENKTGKNVKTIRSDNGGEYTSNEFKNYCIEKGISHEFTNPYTPEQNGVSERFNRTIMEAARSMLIHAKLPLSFWAEAVSSGVYVRNRSPTASLKNKTPYECWFGKKPDLSNLRVFGCISYVHIPDALRRKLDHKSEKCIFVGYPEGTKGYKLFSLRTNRFIRSRSVLFCEDEFHVFNVKGETNNLQLFFPENSNEQELTQNVTDNDVNANDVLIEHNEYPVEAEAVRNTYEERYMEEAQNTERRDRKPPRRLIEESNYAENCLFTESLISEVDEPKSFQDAVNDKNWSEAMTSEISSLMKNNTWDLVPAPAGKNVIGSRWVFKIKRNSDGSIARHKARLVAQGYSQVQGLDYNEVFSPVARFSAIRSLLAIANANDLEVHQMDVKTAFLNGELEHEIYMEQPKGFVDPQKSTYVCKLRKSIYGLKQSARCWNVTLDEYLVSNDYRKSGADGCIYIKTVKNPDEHISFVILAVYVDDIIPVSNDISMLNDEKAKLQRKFDMVDNGEAHYILGMLIKRDRMHRILTISQPNYLQNVLMRFKMENCKPVATPLEMGKKFYKLSDNDKPFDIRLYQQAIGCLTYATTATRPDIAAAVGILAQYMSAPSEDHWLGVKRVLRYLKGTINYGLCFSIDNENNLIGFTDADWAGDIDSRRSTSGYTFHIGESLVSWSSRKQATVAKSSTEAEYVALSLATQEAIWLRRLLNDLGYGMTSPTVINEDNQGAIELSKNPKHHSRTKHIDVSYHFVRERVVSQEVKIEYCPTSDMIADIMTKGLPKVTFEKFRCLLGVDNI